MWIDGMVSDYMQGGWGSHVFTKSCVKRILYHQNHIHVM